MKTREERKIEIENRIERAKFMAVRRVIVKELEVSISRLTALAIRKPDVVGLTIDEIEEIVNSVYGEG